MLIAKDIDIETLKGVFGTYCVLRYFYLSLDKVSIKFYAYLRSPTMKVFLSTDVSIRGVKNSSLSSLKT